MQKRRCTTADDGDYQATAAASAVVIGVGRLLPLTVIGTHWQSVGNRPPARHVPFLQVPRLLLSLPADRHPSATLRNPSPHSSTASAEADAPHASRAATMPGSENRIDISNDESIMLKLSGVSFVYKLCDLPDNPREAIDLLTLASVQHGDWMTVGAYYRRTGNLDAALEVVSHFARSPSTRPSQSAHTLTSCRPRGAGC